MGTQKLLIFLSLAIAAMIGVFFIEPPHSEDPLRFYTWANLYPQSLLDQFTRETKIRVELTYMTSNEEAYAKLRAGATGYDLIQISDYMVRRTALQKMLIPIDHSLIPNFKNIEEKFLNPAFDPQCRHSVPLTWGTSGISINLSKVKVNPEDIGWNIALNSPDPRHTSLFDDMREVYGAILISKGQSINTSDPALIEQAHRELVKIRPRILTFNSEPRSLLAKGELTIAQIYSLDGLQLEKENPHIRYFIPKEGAICSTDNLSIPVGAKKVAEAHQFLDFLLRNDVAVRLATEIRIAPTNRFYREQIPAALRENMSFNPPAEVWKRFQFLEDLGEPLRQMNRLWTELKT